jgi:hypothetical protein
VQRFIAPCALSIAALLGCDARAGEDYRGEVLFQMKGSLVLEQGELAPDSVPALAFNDQMGNMLILDVEAHGEFPASFSIDVMSPPPAKALATSAGLPGDAVGWITALPEDHPAQIDASRNNDGGARTWCKNPDETDCYRSIDTCITGTDQCYHELARCTPQPWPDTMGPWCEEVDEILEQSGDPSIWYFWANFAGLSLDYFLLYVDRSAPAGTARKYIESMWEDGFTGSHIPNVFGNEPITAGYHLVHVRRLMGMERAAGEACVDQIERKYMSEYNQAHGTSFETFYDLEWPLLEAEQDPFANPEIRDLMLKISLGQFDAGCKEGVAWELVDPYENPITVTLGILDQWPGQP